MLDTLISAGSSLLGGSMDAKEARDNRATQVALAKHSIKIRTDDAKNSGIHPLYALGAPTMSTNSFTSGMGSAVADAGSKLGRAISNDYEKTLQKKNLENIQADINLKNAQATNYITEAKNSSNVAMAKQPSTPNLYVPYLDNRTGKTVYLPNPDAGIEMPETVGAGYFIDGKMYQVEQDSKTTPQRRSSPKGYSNNPNPRARKNTPRSTTYNLSTKKGY